MNGQHDALNRLSVLAGIEEGWVDFFGQYRPVPAETKRAFLTAMGFEVTTPEAVAASLAAFEARPWRRTLDPVVVSPEAAGPPSIRLTLPVAGGDAPVDWEVVEENGALHTGKWIPDASSVIGERIEDGLQLRRFRFTLPGTPLCGIHRLRIARGGLGAETTLIITPGHAHLPRPLRDGKGVWGFATQLYALRGGNDWGVGDFSALADLADLAGRQGAAAIGVNPLHALFSARPERFSPYSPSSRKYLNIAYIDVEAVPEFQASAEARRLFAEPAFQADLAAVRQAELIDYPAQARLKRLILEVCWEAFRAGPAQDAESDRGKAYRRFMRDGGDDLRNFAVFEALQAHFLASDPGLGFWRQWPAEYHDPDGPAVGDFARRHADAVGFHIYLQWLADQQLAAAQGACLRGGMPVGLYRDLGVGIADDGAEAWANQKLLCLGVSIGAPPDPLNLAGQDWGLVPFNPFALQDGAYLPFLAVLEANMRHAGAMRLDHAMSLQRLYWVPQGAKADQGAYVRYPVEDLFGLVALASRRKNCLVIGEDLGTVPSGFRERMAERDILGYRLLVFEKRKGRMRPPDEFPRSALIAFGTHDLPSLAGWWRGIDIESRRRLALYPDPALADEEVRQRSGDRSLLREALIGADLLDADFPDGPDIPDDRLERLAEAVHLYLARTPSLLLMAQFEDLLGLSLQMNLPGTTDQHPNWRIRYPREIRAMLADRRLTALTERLAQERPT
ncbi:4-alpha-glucanotransferase [Telmatospirillum siberiense]|uniref:4-alpha-glucanotransferase n=1 Tax=Telmatospirillum siberiense TaxID=382514 RepID=A0A2N3PQD3_9PROT|nr:4-alpha-glucanotransferase [Telmatospirillum siberiense]PKU22604.1 4-alpha-glucanotransferase [Telmatospirillum siberiense]